MFKITSTNVFKFLIVALLSALIIVGCVPPPEVSETTTAVQTSMAVQIPEALALAVNAMFVLLLTGATVYLFEKFGLDLRGYETPVGLALGVWVISELQNYINTVSEIYDPWLNILFRILVVILAPVGFLRLRSGQPKKLIQ